MIIVVDGYDGSGKDTVANAIAKEIGASRLNFPCDEAFTGPMIRSYLRDAWEVDCSFRDGDKYKLSALAFQALQVTNRMELMPRLRAAENGKEKIVLARYWQSAWVYGQLDGLPRDFLERVHKDMAQPIISILLDASPETCLARRQARDGALAPERYEGKLELARKAIDLYRELWSSNYAMDFGGYWATVDAEQPIELVLKDTFHVLRQGLGIM